MLIVSIRKNFKTIGVGTSIIMQTSSFMVGPLCYKIYLRAKERRQTVKIRQFFVKENCRKTKKLRCRKHTAAIQISDIHNTLMTKH
jgi:hypothetical protein